MNKWHHGDVQNLQNKMSCCAFSYTFQQRVSIQRDWIKIKAEVDSSLKQLDEIGRASIDAVQLKEGSRTKSVLCNLGRERETFLK